MKKYPGLLRVPEEQQTSLIDTRIPKLYLVSARDFDGEKYVRLVVAYDENDVKEKDGLNHFDLIFYHMEEINELDGHRVILRKM